MNVLATSLTYFIGRIFDTIPIKYDLVLIDVLDDIESVFYGLSYFFFGSVFLVLGLLVWRVVRLFYPLYQVAERLLYP
ncbi:MAG TPA: hypothetical protein DEA58_07685 [Pseudothermotoga sp.]|nr:hypothetical protein [Pseudothermotoga sp.]